jgi:transposase
MPVATLVHPGSPLPAFCAVAGPPIPSDLRTPNAGNEGPHLSGGLDRPRACPGSPHPLPQGSSSASLYCSVATLKIQEPVLAGIRVPRPGGHGRPRTRPERVIADKGYSYPRCRRLLRQRQIPHTIPERADQRLQRAARPGRPLAFDRATYARRNVVERCINRLKQWRRLATRCEKRAVNYRAMVVLAAIILWLAA